MFKYHLLDGCKNISKVLINNKEVKFRIIKKDNSLYPFNESEASRISNTLIFNKKFNLKKKYHIKVILR